MIFRLVVVLVLRLNRPTNWRLRDEKGFKRERRGERERDKKLKFYLLLAPSIYFINISISEIKV